MPYKTTWENKGIRWKFSGIVTGQDVLNRNMDIYGDPAFDSLRYQIADFTGVTEVTFEERDMQKIAYLDQAAGRSNPRVFVALVADDKNVRELLDFYIHYSSRSPWKIQSFETMETAEEWLSSTLTHY